MGRRRELAELRRQLTAARLVSLGGPGGVGKSRLALRIGSDLGRSFPAGAWLVELAEVHDSSLVGNAVLAALDLRDQAATEPRVLLLSYLRDKELLLLLDNCEHLLAAAAQLASEVVRVAPRVQVIATSREPLSVPGEHVVLVPAGECATTGSCGCYLPIEAVDLDCTPMIEDAGPQVLTALICERVLEERDGVLSAIRIFDRLLVQRPAGDRPAVAQFTVLVVLRKRRSDEESASVSLRLVAPSGTASDTASLDLLFGPGEDDGLNVRVAIATEIREEGRYWVEVISGGRAAAHLPLLVTFVADATQVPGADPASNTKSLPSS